MRFLSSVFSSVVVAAAAHPSSSALEEMSRLLDMQQIEELMAEARDLHGKPLPEHMRLFASERDLASVTDILDAEPATVQRLRSETPSVDNGRKHPLVSETDSYHFSGLFDDETTNDHKPSSVDEEADSLHLSSLFDEPTNDNKPRLVSETDTLHMSSLFDEETTLDNKPRLVSETDSYHLSSLFDEPTNDNKPRLVSETDSLHLSSLFDETTHDHKHPLVSETDSYHLSSLFDEETHDHHDHHHHDHYDHEHHDHDHHDFAQDKPLLVKRTPSTVSTTASEGDDDVFMSTHGDEDLESYHKGDFSSRMSSHEVASIGDEMYAARFPSHVSVDDQLLSHESLEGDDHVSASSSRRPSVELRSHEVEETPVELNLFQSNVAEPSISEIDELEHMLEEAVSESQRELNEYLDSLSILQELEAMVAAEVAKQEAAKQEAAKLRGPEKVAMVLLFEGEKTTAELIKQLPHLTQFTL